MKMELPSIFKEKEEKGFERELWMNFLAIYRPKGVKRILVRNISDMPLSQVFDLVKMGEQKGWDCMVSTKSMVLVCLKGE